MKVYNRNVIYGGDGNMRLWDGDVDGNGDAVLSNINSIKGWCPNPGDIDLLTYFAHFMQSVTSMFTIFSILICRYKQEIMVNIALHPFL